MESHPNPEFRSLNPEVGHACLYILLVYCTTVAYIHLSCWPRTSLWAACRAVDCGLWSCGQTPRAKLGGCADVEHDDLRNSTILNPSCSLSL